MSRVISVLLLVFLCILVMGDASDDDSPSGGGPCGCYGSNGSGDDDSYGNWDDDAYDDNEKCESAYEVFYQDCHMGIVDEQSALLTEGDVVDLCSDEDSLYGDELYYCIIDNEDDCPAILTCAQEAMRPDESRIKTPPMLSLLQWETGYTLLTDFPLAPFADFPDIRAWAGRLAFSVCDLDADLLPEGSVYFYNARTEEELKPLAKLRWLDLHDPNNSDLNQAQDCASPVEVNVLIPFAPESAPEHIRSGMYCVDIQATDTLGLRSDATDGVCIWHNP